MNLDITFCNDGHCKIENCERHQKQLKNIEIGNHPISASDFPYCHMHSAQFLEQLIKRKEVEKNGR